MFIQHLANICCEHVSFAQYKSTRLVSIGNFKMNMLVSSFNFVLTCRMFVPETGGVLNKVMHWYAYDDFDHRDKVRREMAARPEWQQFLRDSRPHVLGPQVLDLARCDCSCSDSLPALVFRTWQTTHT